MAFSLLLAALVVPGQRYLRPQIERLFFAERYALERGVEQLLRELSVSEGPQALLTLAGEQLDALLRPECCVTYERAGADFEQHEKTPIRGRRQTEDVYVLPLEVKEGRQGRSIVHQFRTMTSNNGME